MYNVMKLFNHKKIEKLNFSKKNYFEFTNSFPHISMCRAFYRAISDFLTLYPM